MLYPALRYCEYNPENLAIERDEPWKSGSYCLCLLVCALWPARAALSLRIATHRKAPAQGSLAPEPLSPAGQQELHAILNSGRLPDLQWPNFSQQSAAVKEFYDQAGYRLGWTRGAKPTRQALESIGILRNANQKGLDANDYDGERWEDRLEALQSHGAGSESALVKFDVALTVDAIRYGTDLHLGKVDPKTLHKDFDPDREKHNAGEYLWKT